MTDTSFSEETFKKLFEDYEILRVTFEKADQTIRTINCVRQPPLESQQYVKKTTRTKTPNNEVCSVWDIDIDQWRSFRYDRVFKVENFISDV
jgi:hypothetical protein